MTEKWTPEYSAWRHGGWYVHNVRYPSGAIGCVSRNYPDKKWRIVCGRPHDETFASRDDAARAELAVAAERQRTNPATFVLIRSDGHLFSVWNDKKLAEVAKAKAETRWTNHKFTIYREEMNSGTR